MTEESESKRDESQTDSGSNGPLDGKVFVEKSGFTLEQLFKISAKFFKDNQNKAFHPSYDERNHLLALILQVNHGAFNEKDAPPLGPFDIVGRDRRQAWKDLGELSTENAMEAFVLYLDKLCFSLRPYIEAHKREKDDQEEKLKMEEERQRLEKMRLEEEEKSRALNKAREEELKRFEDQKIAIQEALNRQTAQQFTAYAQQQYPNNSEQQEILIKQLQEQHYQQYMQQMLQHQLKAQNNKNLQSHPSHGSYPPLLNNENQGLPSYQSTAKVNLVNALNSDQDKAQLEASSGNQNEKGNEATDSSEEEVEDDGPLANAQMWTRKDIKAFKESISKDCGDGIIKVGHGEIVTVRVPTHPDGTCIFWEFATDSYDIGFGLLFEWTKNPGNQVSVHISESEDEDEDDEEEDDEDDEENPNPVKLSAADDLEKGSGAEAGRSSVNDATPCSVIIPIYRRDCHEEVYAGSHPYPGKGVYLLKFDNSYSLWRSKTLYYRVYYTR